MVRAKRKNKKITCYFCDKEYSSKEHVPPKCFFPEKGELSGEVDYRKNLITVPSCTDHNLGKSNDDEYLLFTIASSLRVSNRAQKIFSDKIVRAITRRPSLAYFFKDNFLITLNGKETLGYKIDKERFNQAISKISSALYYSQYKEKWIDNFFIYSPDIFSLDSNETNKMIHELEVMTGHILSSEGFLGDNPEIFRYKIFRKDNRLLVRMLFYQGAVINAFSENNQLVTIF